MLVRPCFWDFMGGKATALTELRRLDRSTLSSASLLPREGAVQVNLATLLFSATSEWAAMEDLALSCPLTLKNTKLPEDVSQDATRINMFFFTVLRQFFTLTLRQQTNPP